VAYRKERHRRPRLSIVCMSASMIAAAMGSWPCQRDVIAAVWCRRPCYIGLVAALTMFCCWAIYYDIAVISVVSVTLHHQETFSLNDQQSDSLVNQPEDDADDADGWNDASEQRTFTCTGNNAFRKYIVLINCFSFTYLLTYFIRCTTARCAGCPHIQSRDMSGR